MYHGVMASPMYASAYHLTYPYRFIITSGIFFFVSVRVSNTFIYKNKFQYYFLFYFVWATLTLFSCGLLWSYFDMKAGYFLKGRELWGKLFTDMLLGVPWGIYVIALSLPFNIFVLLSSFYILKKIRAIKLK